jgi:hypothetical protein
MLTFGMIRVSAAIRADTLKLQVPDFKTPFSSLEDAIKRLLPYHLYQYPDEDLRPFNPKENQDATNTKTPEELQAERVRVLSDAAVFNIHEKAYAMVSKYRNILTDQSQVCSFLLRLPLSC